MHQDIGRLRDLIRQAPYAFSIVDLAGMLVLPALHPRLVRRQTLPERVGLVLRGLRLVVRAQWNIAIAHDGVGHARRPVCYEAPDRRDASGRE